MFTMWPFKKKSAAVAAPLTLGQALDELKRIGVAIAPSASLDDLLPSLDGGLDDAIDRVHLLCVLGGEAECSDAGLLSHDVWHLDAECIEDNGDYTRLAERFRVLAGGHLPLQDIKDHVDVGNAEAWLEFGLEGRTTHWDLTVNDDWMDPALYSNFQKLVASRTRSGQFMISALGQDSLVLFGDDNRRHAISAFSGLEFHWE